MFTMNDHKRRLPTSLRSMSWVPFQNVAAQIKVSMTHTPKRRPEEAAATFYSANHVLKEIASRVNPDMPLGKFTPLVNSCYELITLEAVRLFHYLILICTREARHAHGSFEKSLATKFGKDVALFQKKVADSSSSSAVTAMLDAAPNVTIGSYTEFLEWIFFNASFSSGYGGKAWGQVAQVLNRFVHGTYSAELMLDTGFTLAHNNGPIFNKGMLYEGYGHYLYTILDVQAAGQVPSLRNSSEFKNFHHVKTLLKLANTLGVSFPEEVDWYLVDKTNGTTKYKKFYKPDSAGLVPPIPKATPKAAVSQPTLSADSVYIMPGLTVKKVVVQR